VRHIIFLAAVLLSCAPKPRSNAWQVTRNFIRDANGRAITLRGMQMGGDQKSPPYLDSTTIADYQRIHDQWGFNSIRFLMVWAAIEPQEGQYDQSYLDGLAERMDWAQQAGLSVILDMHQDIYGEGFGFDGAPKWACPASYYAAFVPTTPWGLDALNPNVEACTDQLYSNPTTLAHFTEAWRQVALNLKDKPAVIGFDLLNEPEWGTSDPTTFEGQTLEPFYEHVVPVIRSEAPNWLAFLEPSSSRNFGFATSLKPFPFPNVVYSPHSYDLTAEQGSPYPLTDTPAVITNAGKLWQEAKSLNAALWIGEYGGETSDPTIGPYMNAEYTAIGDVAGGSSYWSYGMGGYGPLTSDGNEIPALVDAIALPYPTFTAGDPMSYAFDPTTSTFTYVYTPDTKIMAPTEIVVPARVYPNGYAIECGGCATTRTATGLNVTKPASGGTTTVVLHP
jgi:endoglycosylceramidase